MCVVSMVVQYFLWMDVREMRARVGSLEAGLKLNGVKWSLVVSHFADDTSL